VCVCVCVVWCLVCGEVVCGVVVCGVCGVCGVVVCEMWLWWCGDGGRVCSEMVCVVRVCAVWRLLSQSTSFSRTTTPNHPTIPPYTPETTTHHHTPHTTTTKLSFFILKFVKNHISEFSIKLSNFSEIKSFQTPLQRATTKDETKVFRHFVFYIAG